MLNKRSARLVVLVTIWTATVTYSGAYGGTPIATDPQAEGKSLTSEGTMLRDLFDRWERVWHEGQYDLVAQCVQPNYIRHDEAGDRTVHARLTRRRLLRPGRSDPTYGSLCMITHSRATARGSALSLSGLILKLATSARGQECRFTGSRTACSRRLGLCSNR
jgi:hypothetical protein